MKPQQLDLNSEILSEFRNNFEIALNSVIRQMTERKMPGGTLTAKIDIEIREETAESGEIIRTMKVQPDIGVKIGAKGKINCREQNGIYLQIGRDGQPIVASEQISMDDLLDEKKGA